MIVCSASSWITCWIGLEVNLIRFIPLLLSKISSFSTEASIKYFITQAIGSIIIIFSAVFININTQINNIVSINEILTVAVAIKIGLAPFHIWFPQVIELTEWTQATILITWQKIAPFILLSFNKSTIRITLIITSAIIGIAGGFNQNSIKKILTYSSIAHLAWIYSIIIINEKTWWIYLGVYSRILILVITPLSKSNTITLNKLNNTPSGSNLKIVFYINFLSIAGIPPLLGILPKAIVIISILGGIWINKIIILLTLIVTSLITLFYYLKLFYSSIIMFINNNQLIHKKTHVSTKINNLLTISVTGNLVLVPLVLFV